MPDFLPQRGKRPVKGVHHPHRANLRLYWGREDYSKTHGGHRGEFPPWRRREGLGLRQIQILEGPWGHLIAAGRPNTRRGHGIVGLRRLTVIIIRHGRSFFPVQKGCRPFIEVFDRCESILRLLTGDSTNVVDRRRRGVNPRPNTHTVVWWPDETSPTCLSKWSETIEA